MDTIIGRQQKGAILTIVERTTGMFIIKKLPKGKQAKGLSKELINRLMPYKKHILSITSDRHGTEFADHQNIAKNPSYSMLLCPSVLLLAKRTQ